jgi:hypothetical protein
MHAFLAQPSDHLPIPVPAFGAWIRHRRLELGLNCTRAATMTGIDRSDWNALEAGWVPNKDERLLRSLAGTLQVDFSALVSAIAPLEGHFAETAA